MAAYAMIIIMHAVEKALRVGRAAVRQTVPSTLGRRLDPAMGGHQRLPNGRHCTQPRRRQALPLMLAVPGRGPHQRGVRSGLA